MKKVLISFAILLLFTGAAIAGTSLSAKDEKAISEAGLSVYPGSVVITGLQALGIAFATSDSVEKVRKWYRNNTPDWTVYEDDGMWVLYDSKSMLNPFEIMSKRQVLVNKNENLPYVHKYDKSVTTEIVIIVPDGK
jgi:hypothetical protein